MTAHPEDEVDSQTQPVSATVSARFFRAFPAAAKAIFGPAAFALFVDGLSPGLKAALASGAPDTAIERVDAEVMQLFVAAVFDGLAKNDVDRFRAFVGRAVTDGFGVGGQVRLNAFSARTIAAFAATLWKEDHDTGTLDVDEPGASEGEGELTLVLRDHPFVGDPVAAMTLAYFYEATLASAGDGGRTHVEVDAVSPRSTDGATELRLRFRWTQTK